MEAKDLWIMLRAGQCPECSGPVKELAHSKHYLACDTCQRTYRMGVGEAEETGHTPNEQMDLLRKILTDRLEELPVDAETNTIEEMAEREALQWMLQCIDNIEKVTP